MAKIAFVVLLGLALASTTTESQIEDVKTYSDIPGPGGPDYIFATLVGGSGLAGLLTGD